MFKRLPGFLFFLLITIVGNAQSEQPILIIEEIIITGNKKTKQRIIKRELSFEVGDTLEILKFEEETYLVKNRLLSTGLFNEVQVYFKNFGTKSKKCDVHIDVTENWYIYPSPIFELADRNFNVWWSEMNRSLDRVDYGLRIDHYNLTGNRDKLKLKLQGGYTRKYELDYHFPYINDSQTIGIGGNLFYSDQKEVPFKTAQNKSLFASAQDERKLLKRFRSGVELNYRPEIFFNHFFSLEFHRNSIDTLISENLNPDYFLDQRSSLSFFAVEYYLVYNKLVFDVYPLEGYLILFDLKKEGLGLFNEYNNLSTFVEFQKHISLSKNLITSFRLKAKTNIIRNKVAFANNTAMGYGDDIISGYDLYVIDGTDFVLGETQVKYRVFTGTKNLDRFMPIEAFRKLRFDIFLRWNTDFGYVNERHYVENNELNNKWLIGFGPSIDVLFYNTFLFKFEYTFNQLGDQGLYLRSTNSF